MFGLFLFACNPSSKETGQLEPSSEPSSEPIVEWKTALEGDERGT